MRYESIEISFLSYSVRRIPDSDPAYVYALGYYCCHIGPAAFVDQNAISMLLGSFSLLYETTFYSTLTYLRNKIATFFCL